MRTKSTLLTLGAILVIGVSPVLAANPHFVQADFNAYEGAIQDLNIDFHVAGLGNSTGATMATAAGTFQVTVTCVNKGKNNKEPKGLQGPKTRTVNSTEAYPDATGQFVGTLPLNSTPPICPRGMDYDLSSFVVDWTDITMTLSNGDGDLDSYLFQETY